MLCLPLAPSAPVARLLLSWASLVSVGLSAVAVLASLALSVVRVFRSPASTLWPAFWVSWSLLPSEPLSWLAALRIESLVNCLVPLGMEVLGHAVLL